MPGEPHQDFAFDAAQANHNWRIHRMLLVNRQQGCRKERIECVCVWIFYGWMDGMYCCIICFLVVVILAIDR